MSDDPGCILPAFWSVILEASNDCGSTHEGGSILREARYFAPSVCPLHLDLDAWKVVVMCLHGNWNGGAMKCKCAQDLKEPPEEEICLVMRDILPKCTNINLSRCPRPPMCLCICLYKYIQIKIEMQISWVGWSTISQDASGHPCVFLGQKVLNRAAQIGGRLHLKNWTRGCNCI